jgi:hypothetical protein
VGQHTGLARTGTGEDKGGGGRTGDRFALRVVQRVEDGLYVHGAHLSSQIVSSPTGCQQDEQHGIFHYTAQMVFIALKLLLSDAIEQVARMKRSVIRGRVCAMSKPAPD